MFETKVMLTLDVRSKKKDDTYPIKINVLHKSKNRLISIGRDFSVLEKDWNFNRREVRASVKNAGRLRAKTESKLNLARGVIDTQRHLLDSMTIQQLTGLIKDAFKKPMNDLQELESIEQVDRKIRKGLTLREWSNKLVKRRRDAKKFSTGDGYNDAVNSLLSFYGNEGLLLKECTKTLLEDYKANHLGKGLKVGGLNTRLRALRAVLNYAVGEEELDAKNNPFNKTLPEKKRVIIPSAASEDRDVNPDIINAFKKLYQGEQVKELKLKEDSSDWHCVCEGIFMWETFAMNMKDLVKLKVKDGLSDIISYERSKTGARIKVVQTELSMEIAKKYAANKTPNDFLFRYGWENSERGHERYKLQRKRWAQRMTGMAKKMGFELDQNFTTYVLRHTLATTLNENGVARDDIGKMYGHKDGRSIDTYIGQEDIYSLSEKARKALDKI